MQVVEKPNLKPVNSPELIATYFGRKIFLKRLVVNGVDRGLWLKWHHPRDRGRHSIVEYGQFVPSEGVLPEILYLVQTIIRETVELETMHESEPKRSSTAESSWMRCLKQWSQ